MKRDRLPVIATSPTGEQFELGHISRVTRSCLIAFLKREGFDNLPPEAKGRDWRRLNHIPDPAIQYRVAFASDGWTLAVEKRNNANA